MIKPSGLLACMVASMCALGIGIGTAIALGSIGDLSTAWRTLIGAWCVLASIGAALLAIKPRKTFHIDISGVGQIRLREYIELTASSARAGQADADRAGKMVRLMSDSTIWPHLLLLRLQDQDGRTTVLPVFRDSMTQDSFRALSVACLWIAAQNNRAESMAV